MLGLIGHKGDRFPVLKFGDTQIHHETGLSIPVSGRLHKLLDLICHVEHSRRKVDQKQVEFGPL